MLQRTLSVPAVLAIVAMAGSAYAQESQGTILGRITDTTDLVVPAAVVQVTNVATGFTSKTTSNASGNYYAPFLVPGTYRITVAKEGFKTFIREGIVLNVNDRL